MNKINIHPTTDGANDAANNNHIEILNWLARRDILPTIDAANYAEYNGHVEILNWLAQRGIFPTTDPIIDDDHQNVIS